MIVGSPATLASEEKGPTANKTQGSEHETVLKGNMHRCGCHCSNNIDVDRHQSNADADGMPAAFASYSSNFPEEERVAAVANSIDNEEAVPGKHEVRITNAKNC